MKKGSMYSLIVISILVMGLFLGCKEKKETATNVGIIVPLTGGYSDVGNWMKVGVELAVEDINNKELITKLNLIYEDSQSKPNLAISAYQNLKNNKKTNLFISTVSSVCLALKPLAAADSIFLLVNAGHKDIISKENPTIFRHALTIPQEATFMSSYINANFGITSETKICFLYTNNDIGAEYKDIFLQNMAIPKINTTSYEESEINLKNIVTKSLNTKPNYVVIYGYTKNLGQLIKTFRELGYNGLIFANQGFSTPSVIESAGVAGNDVYYSDYDIPDNAEIQSLKNRIKEKCNTDLSSMNITSYNAIMLIAMALEHGNKTPIEISEFLKSNSPFNINGMNITINSDGEIYVPLKIVKNEYKLQQ